MSQSSHDNLEVCEGYEFQIQFQSVNSYLSVKRRLVKCWKADYAEGLNQTASLGSALVYYQHSERTGLI